MYDFSIVIPVYNEEEIVEDFYFALCRAIKNVQGSFEIIFSTGGNTDNTLSILKKIRSNDKKLKIINMSQRFDYQAALMAGLDMSSGKAVITLDGDFQHPPELVPVLIDEWKQGFDIVYTIREDSLSYNILKKLGSKTFYYLLKVMTKIDIEENAADFRLLSRKALNSFKQYSERKRYIPGIISLIGFKRKGIRYFSPQRKKGKSKFSITRLFSLALDGIFSFSNIPLRSVIFIGFIMIFLSFCYLVYVIVIHFLHPEAPPGWASILASILFLSSIQIFILGLLGEYIGRAYEESKRRPLYIVDELIGFDNHE